MLAAGKPLSEMVHIPAEAELPRGVVPSMGEQPESAAVLPEMSQALRELTLLQPGQFSLETSSQLLVDAPSPSVSCDGLSAPCFVPRGAHSAFLFSLTT